MKRQVEPDELVEHWTLLDDEQERVVDGSRGSAARRGSELIAQQYDQMIRYATAIRIGLH
ncbi:hypothetical protein [Cryptosporangium minutisporangium]|uniref:Uncharacterized protein n=1 Tax=Cryptosporangium minutisporangium TaxID=113569 RepID=A0ABP6SZJ3_9ACTN